MPGKSFPVDVNPAVLQWARETGGYSEAEAGERVADPEALSAWESGKARPTWSVLRKLAKLYKRPVASLLLPAPPREPPLPPDFRTLPHTTKRLSPRTRFAIRTATWLATTAAELQQQLGVKAPLAAPRIQLSADPESAAEQCRELLGIPLQEQTGWRTLSEACRRWREAVESQHVFVFQSSMDVEELRGFSLIEANRPVIVLNQSDALNARIFTLFHEYCHLLLARPGICLPEEGAMTHGPHLETFCNRFAAALLIPATDLQEHTPANVPLDKAVGSLAHRYWVSRPVVLGRMRSIGAISTPAYQEALRRLTQKPVPLPRRPQKGGPSMVERVLSERGRAFVSLVIEATKRDAITVNDATGYLGIKLKHLPKVEARIK
jgi:Zn-dependent peptidase ImmA (M78 family)